MYKGFICWSDCTHSSRACDPPEREINEQPTTGYPSTLLLPTASQRIAAKDAIILPLPLPPAPAARFFAPASPFFRPFSFSFSFLHHRVSFSS
jgi:hypothetical protein